MVADFILTLLARLARAGANVVIVAYVARLVSKESLGGYFLSFSISTPLTFLLLLGVGLATVRAVAQAGDLRGSMVGNIVMSAHAAVAIASFLLLLVIVPLLQFAMPALTSSQVLLSCFIGFVGAMQNLQSDCFRAVHLYKQSSIYANTLPSLAPLILLVFVYYLDVKVDLSTLLEIYLLGSVASLFISTLVLYQNIDFSIQHNSFICVLKEARMLIKSGAGNLASLSIGVILPSISLYLCALWFGAEESASLGLAQRILFFISLPLWLVSTVLPPKVSALIHAEKYDELRKSLNGFSALIVTSSFAIVLLVTWYAEPLITIVAGANDSLAVSLVRILSWFALLYATFAVALSAVMVSKKNTGLYFSFGVALTMFSITVYPLTVAYGVMGIAIAQSIATLANAAVGQVILKRNTGIWVWPNFASAWHMRGGGGRK